MKLEVHWFHGFKFDRFFMDQVLLRILYSSNEFLSRRFRNVFRIGLFFKDDLDVHLGTEFLIAEMNGDFLPTGFAQEAEELPPEPIELLRLGIGGQPPTPEILDA